MFLTEFDDDTFVIFFLTNFLLAVFLYLFGWPLSPMVLLGVLAFFLQQRCAQIIIHRFFSTGFFLDYVFLF